MTEVIEEMATVDDKAEFDKFPSPILESCLSALGVDVQRLSRVLQHLWNSENRTFAMIGVWFFESIANIVAQVDDALLPEEVALRHTQLEKRDIEFEDLSLGEQIIERFLLGKKHHGRPTPWDWETGIPLSGLFNGYRLTDCSFLQDEGKNSVRFAIIDAAGKPISGTLPLVGLDRLDRWVEAIVEQMRLQSDSLLLSDQARGNCDSSDVAETEIAKRIAGQDGSVPPRWSRPMKVERAVAKMEACGNEMSRSTFDRYVEDGVYKEHPTLSKKGRRIYDLNLMPPGFEDALENPPKQ